MIAEIAYLLMCITFAAMIIAPFLKRL